MLLKNTKTEKEKWEEPREREDDEAVILDGFKPDSKRFLRDRDSTKLNGKFYKLSNAFNCVKIDLETVMVYESRERKLERE